MSPLTWATALRTPLPRYFDLSASRSSRASCSPVDAPEGTAARPLTPTPTYTSASTVGLPRESMIWRAWTRVIFVDISVVLLDQCQRRFYWNSPERPSVGER